MLERLANNIVNYSCNISRDDRVYLYCYGENEVLLNVIIEKIKGNGAKHTVKKGV